MAKLLRTFFVFFAFCGLGATAAKADPSGFLLDLKNEAVAELTDQSLDEAERAEKFRVILNDNFDLPRIGRFVLGRYWNQASDSEREDFLATFEEAMVQRFAPIFKDYAGVGFDINGERQDGQTGHHIVSSTVITPGGEPAEVDWRISEDEGGTYKILDVTAEGVSFALTLRSEYGTVIQSEGITGLIDILEEKAAEYADSNN